MTTETTPLDADFRRSASERQWAALFVAWIVSLAATSGALFFGEVVGHEPCFLCWWQRVAMFPLVLILGLAAWRGDRSVVWSAAPLATGGAAVAAWHLLVYFDVAPVALQPCGAGPSCASGDMTIFGGVPLPLLALIAFAAILACLVFAAMEKTER